MGHRAATSCADRGSDAGFDFFGSLEPRVNTIGPDTRNLLELAVRDHRFMCNCLGVFVGGQNGGC